MTENDLAIEIANYMSRKNGLGVGENIKLLSDRSAELLSTLKIKWEDLDELIFPLEKRFNFKISNQKYWDMRIIGDLLDLLSPVVKKFSPKLPYQSENICKAIRKATFALCQKQHDGRPDTSMCEGPHAIG